MQKPFVKGLNSRSSWSDEEDAKLIELVQALGQHNWALIAQELPGRVGKQCRERWRNHLDPSIRHDPFSEEEDATVLRLVSEVGTRWARIAEQMPGRTENSIKNRFYCFLKRKAEASTPRPAKKPRVAATPPQSPSLSPTVQTASDSDGEGKGKMLPPATRSSSRRSPKLPVRQRKSARSPRAPKRALCFAPLTPLPLESPAVLFGSQSLHQLLLQQQPQQQSQPQQFQTLPSATDDSCLWSAARVLCTLRDA